MHVVYKLIALSVVFGLVLTNPVAKTTDPEFDDLAYEGEFSDMFEDSVAVADSPVGVVVPKIGLAGVIGALVGIIPKVFKIVGLKIKAVTLVAKFIKWLVPKSLFLIIGAIATFFFCKCTGLCTLGYAPVVAELVPTEVRSLVTPERIQDAQQLLTSALQLYMQEEYGH